MGAPCTPPDPGGSALLPEYRARSGPASHAAGVLAYLGLWVLLLALLPDAPVEIEALQGVAIIGVIGLWRWSWAGVHLARMLLYRRVVFPAMRARAEQAPPPGALHIIVTSYRIAAEMNAAVYSRLLDELEAMGVPAVIVACASDPADATLLGGLLRRRTGLAEGTVLHVLMQDGTGKRSAMAAGLRLILAGDPRPGSQVILMDGDTLLAPGSLSATCGILAAHRELGAVTTGNLPLVSGHAWTREWYRLRMLQRDALMCSMSLSRRLLVLTGRFSVFRAEVVRDPDFLRRVESDTVTHWRLGSLRLVTGDDKSTWFSTLSQGWRMAYVPDVKVFCLEELPAGGFLRATTALMTRWFGNMSRNSGRGIALGPRRLGFFAWASLLDQRVSPWTTLSGPLAVLYAAFVHDPGFVVLYLMWILATRGAWGVLVWLTSGSFHPFFPLLLYYGQISGALVKVFIFHHPDRQRWTRQKVAPGGAAPARGLSGGFLALSACAFVLLVVVLSGAPWTEPHQGAPTGIAALFDPSSPAGSPAPTCATRGAVPCIGPAPGSGMAGEPFPTGQRAAGGSQIPKSVNSAR
ncbi:glycosyltransferase [Pararoseomonas indoligenes]|uniref:Glycosyltransferase n=1 Tax=Roseomonas indoligenes TaxID=2820811 RepID=A0A940N3X9_9PROT|nr:glycosyltransferase [Pararoseomonas indoligenes]MBP0496247.1 glycosyltransferase [Pararoseomonas indoligenes]